MTFRILSFDGGGIRGVVSATMLAVIEKMINQPLNQYFQLIAGTSTGSIIAAGVASDRSGLEMVDVYQKKGSRIFPYKSRWSPDRLPLVFQYGLSAPKYSDKGLIDVLKEELKYKRLSDVTSVKVDLTSAKPKFQKAGLLLTAYDTINREPIIFKSWRKKFAHTPLWEACLCSASAPTVFPAHKLERKEEGVAQGGDANTIMLSSEASDDNDDYNRMQIEIIGGTGKGQIRTISAYRGKTHLAKVDVPWDVIPNSTSTYRVAIEYSVIDGGVGANNPTACAIAEALRLGYEPSEIAVLSLGTGNMSREIPLQSAQEWGAVQWALPIIDVMFDASSDINDYIARQVVDNRYIRLQFKLDRKLTGKRLSDDMDDASPQNVANLIEAAKAYMSQPLVKDQLTEFFQS